MIGSRKIAILLVIAVTLNLPTRGVQAAQPESELRASPKTGTPSNARYDWEKQNAYAEPSKKASTKKSTKKNKAVAKTTPQKRATSASSKRKTTYRSVGSTRKSRSRSAASASFLPSPREEGGNSFVVEVSSPTDPRLERAYLQLRQDSVVLPRMPDFATAYRGRVAGLSEQGDFIQYTVDPTLQEYARAIVSRVPAPHVAVVAMEPASGRILAVAGKSTSLQSAVMHAGYPAASLIKVITSAAALEHASIDPLTPVAFRGGTYELTRYNYDPRPGADKRRMTVSEALGRSCNPVFSRVALQFLNPSLLRYQTAAFGFNTNLGLQVPLMQSIAEVPNDSFEFGRTAAGFGAVYLSPIHAAALMSAVANEGRLPRPSIIDQIITPNGDVKYRFTPGIMRQSVRPETAETLMRMMTSTTTIGTSRHEFAGRVPWEVSAKTGTLSGVNPKGLNTWFIGAAPLERPRIAVSVIVVNPSGQVSSKASHIGRLLLEKYLG